MEAEFWHQRWQEREIGFHLEEVNPLLSRHFTTLGLSARQRVLVPLCGKTQDMAWLLSQGYEVIGVELSRLAVDEFFEEQSLSPDINTEEKPLIHYRAENIHIIVGDFFAVSANDIGKIDAIYDRAAMVALPEKMRSDYRKHLLTITAQAPQLLITFAYDQQLMEGPPFSVDHNEVMTHYQDIYQLQPLETLPVEGGLRGLMEIEETVWYLSPR